MLWILLIFYGISCLVIFNKITVFRVVDSRNDVRKPEKAEDLWGDFLLIQASPWFLFEHIYPVHAQAVCDLLASRVTQARSVAFVSLTLSAWALSQLMNLHWVLIVLFVIFDYLSIGFILFNIVFLNEEDEEAYFDYGPVGALEKIGWFLNWPRNVFNLGKELSRLAKNH